MTLCLNPQCQYPHNSDNDLHCLKCGSKLLLKDRYRALKLLGSGGFGKTFLGVDEDKPAKPLCAIKQFSFSSDNPQALEKATELFKREAVRLESLGNHPQIPDLLAFSQQDGQLYLVQEFIEGATLEQELQQQGVYDEAKIWLLLLDLLPVLEFVHQHQVIHRDIKPENIIRSAKNNKLVLIDFGVAKLNTETALMQPLTNLGTMGYASDEQMRGNQVFPASDLYSLGATCIRLMTGKFPSEMFDAYNGVWLWQKFLPKETVVSENLNQVLDKLIRPNCRERYQSAQEVLQVIESFTAPETELDPQTRIEPKTGDNSEDKTILEIEYPEPGIVTTVDPDKSDKKPSKATEVTHWLLGEKAGRVTVTAWKWLWGNAKGIVEKIRNVVFGICS
jgi:serine/threonine protein kinase